MLKKRVSQKFNVLMEQFILFLYKVSFRITVLQLKLSIRNGPDNERNAR